MCGCAPPCRWSTNQALQAGPPAVTVEWASLGSLLATIIAAHRPSLPTVAAREALDAAVAALLSFVAVIPQAEVPPARLMPFSYVSASI